MKYLLDALEQIKQVAESRPDCVEGVDVRKLCEEALCEERLREETRKQAELDLKAIWGIG